VVSGYFVGDVGLMQGGLGRLDADAGSLEEVWVLMGWRW